MLGVEIRIPEPVPALEKGGVRAWWHKLPHLPPRPLWPPQPFDDDVLRVERRGEPFNPRFRVLVP